jgi:hypothetical protein
MLPLLTAQPEVTLRGEAVLRQSGIETVGDPAGPASDAISLSIAA